ncbi:ribonuclease-like [Anableps anableps]
MKILPFCLLVFLLPLQAIASECMNTTSMSEVEKDTRERYNTFKRQHVDKKMTAQKCTAVMKQKRIYDNNSCKKINTFILADAKEVKSICDDQGVYNNESHYTESKRKFRVVVCRTKKQARKPKCEYTGKLLTNRVIVVSCQDGLPVHYASNHI